jgi:hypothetical protein
MKDKKMPWIVGGLALALLLAAFYFGQKRAKPRFDWQESSWTKKGYSETSDQPYGTQVARRLLDAYFSNKKCVNIEKKVAVELPKEGASFPANYVFVGEGMYMDSLDTRCLLDFVAAGNTALISSKSIPFDLMTFVYFSECPNAIWSDYDSHNDTLTRLSLRTPVLVPDTIPLQFVQQNRRRAYNWHYIGTQFFCDSLSHVPLGYLDDTFVNFAVFPHGKGRFLLHTTPLAFSNYALTQSDGKTYLEGVLSHLPAGDIYWDAVSRVPEAVSRRRNGSRYDGGGLEDEHLLSFILKQPALAWAWYLLAGLTGVWLLFRAKRRQRIIPVLPKNENTSYEFISTIAQLHFREEDFFNLCVQNMRLFFSDVRERYNLSVPFDNQTKMYQVNDVFVRQLTMASQVPEAQIKDLFRQYEAAVRFQPLEHMAVELHQSIERFWAAAKK